jgi:hypothetical protein
VCAESAGDCLDRRREHHVAGEAVTLRHDEHARAMQGERLHRGEEPWTLVDRRGAGRPVVEVKGGDGRAVGARPSLDCVTLRGWTKVLLVGRDAQVGHGDPGDGGGSGG